MQHVPMMHGVDLNPAMSRYMAKGSMMMGLTAEMLAQVHKIELRADGRVRAPVPQAGARRDRRGSLRPTRSCRSRGMTTTGAPKVIDTDEVIREDASLESLGSLPPAFVPKVGKVTAGSSSAISDGASAMLVMSGEKAMELGVTPRARVVSMAVSGCDPAIMGYGPVPASKKALKRAGMEVSTCPTSSSTRRSRRRRSRCCGIWGSATSWTGR